jgi:hypothetical protein
VLRLAEQRSYWVRNERTMKSGQMVGQMGSPAAEHQRHPTPDRCQKPANHLREDQHIQLEA